MSGNPNPPTEHLAQSQWKPGQSGNPAGRPVGARSRTTLVRELLEARLDANHDYAQAMTKAVMEKAMTGDVPAYKELMDSAYGKIADKQELTGAEGAPLNLGVKFMDSKAEGETLGTQSDG